MKLPTIEAVKSAQSISIESGDEFGKALNRLQNWGRLADKISRRGSQTDEEAEFVCQIRHKMSIAELEAMPEETDEDPEPCTLTFAEWHELADMPVKTKDGWVDMETGIPFYRDEEKKIETIGVDIFVATGSVD